MANTTESDPRINRRRVLRGIGAAGAVSLAGCTGILGGGMGPHRHVNLTIEIRGKTREIPADVGIGEEYADSPYYDDGMGMTSIHTHDTSGTIHWEIMNRDPMEGEFQLGAFFEIWDKTFTADCIFDACKTGDGTVSMLVNDTTNDKFAEYTVSDEDEIIIRYE